MIAHPTETRANEFGFGLKADTAFVGEIFFCVKDDDARRLALLPPVRGDSAHLTKYYEKIINFLLLIHRF